MYYVCRFIAKQLHTKVPGLVRGGGEDITNCDWIDLTSWGSFLSLRSIGHALEEVKIFEKIHRETLDRGQEPSYWKDN